MADLTEVRTWRKELKQPSTGRHCGKWRKPPAGYIKINCDASVSSDGCGIGVIARDSNGQVRFVGARRIQDDTDPAIAEGEAMLWALAFARDLQLEFTIIESDCLSVVSKLRCRNCGNGVLGSLLGMCIKAVSRGGLVVWLHTKRSGNEAANLLAHIKPSFNFVDFDLTSFPAGLLHIVSADLD